MLMRRISLILSMLVFSAAAFAQSGNYFTENQGEFLAQLKALMSENKQTELEQVYKDFEASFGAAAYTEAEFMKMVSISNTMRTQRLAVSPYLKTYLQALMASRKTADPAARFTDMHRVLEAILGEPNRKANDVAGWLDFLVPFFTEKAIRTSRLGVNWYVLNDKYQLDYVSGQPVVFFEQLNLIAVRNTDSIEITHVAGTFYPLEQRFSATTGRVSWERRGLDAEVYVVLKDFDIDVTKGLYEASQAILNYPLFFRNATDCRQF